MDVQPVAEPKHQKTEKKKTQKKPTHIHSQPAAECVLEPSAAARSSPHTEKTRGGGGGGGGR